MTLSSEPILVGREKELTKLNAYLDSAIAGRGATIFVSGEAGSGKTRLTSEFMLSARKKGVRILAGWCLSNATVPYFPFIEAFETYTPQNENEDQFQVLQQLNPKKWLMGLNESSNEGSPQAWKDQRFSMVTQSLLSLSSEKPVLLFIDDLHWADSASLSLLHYIARLIRSERVLILGTFRAEEIVPPTEGFAPPILDTLHLLGREDLYDEIKLPNLNKSNTKNIAESLLKGPVSQDLVEKIFKESQGNPLFTIESLRMLFENGCIIKDSKIWRLAEAKFGVPKKVRDIIIRRLNGLKPRQRRILDVASVIGDKFDPQLIGAVLNTDSLNVLQALNSIALSQSLVCADGDYYWFDHAKTREVLYDQIFKPLKVGYHLRIAEKLERIAKGQSKLPLNDLAHHYSQARHLSKSIQYSLLAGKDALLRYSNSEAIKHFKYVIDSAEDLPEYSINKLEALEGLADAFYANGLFQEAGKIFETIFESNTSKSESQGLRALRKAVISYYWLGNSKRSLELAGQAEKFASTDSLEYARLQVFAGFVLGRSSGNLEKALNDMRASLAVFEEKNSSLDIADALKEISFIYSLHGDNEEALSSAFRSVALYNEFNDQRQLAFAMGRLGTALGTAGFFKEAVEMLAEANKLAEKVMDYNTIAFHLMMSGLYLERLNENNAALAQSLEALTAAEKTDAHYIKLICLANLVREYAALGKVELAEERFEKMQALFERDPLLSSNVNAVYCVEMSRAILLYCNKEGEAACEILEKILKIEGRLTRILFAAILNSLGRLKEAQDQIDIIQKLKEDAELRSNSCNIKPYLLLNRQSSINQEIVLRIDIVNVGGKAGTLNKIIEMLPFRANVSSLPPGAIFKNNSLHFDAGNLTPLTNKIIKATITPLETGRFTLKPIIVYADENGKTKNVSTNAITLIVEDKERLAASERPPIEFKSETSQMVFQFLAKSFNDDTQRKISGERAGWRSLMDIVKHCKVSKHSVYDSTRKHGTIISELERSKLIETKIFSGERGRGGDILKVRVAKVEQR